MIVFLSIANPIRDEVDSTTLTSRTPGGFIRWCAEQLTDCIGSAHHLSRPPPIIPPIIGVSSLFAYNLPLVFASPTDRPLDLTTP